RSDTEPGWALGDAEGVAFNRSRAISDPSDAAGGVNDVSRVDGLEELHAVVADQDSVASVKSVVNERHQLRNHIQGRVAGDQALLLGKPRRDAHPQEIFEDR